MMIDEKVLVERLEEERGHICYYMPCNGCKYIGDCNDRDHAEDVALDKAIEIVNQLAEESNNGWILCSERLPEKNQKCLIQYNGSLSGRKDYIDTDTYNGERFEFFGIKGVIAWQPLPPRYEPKE